MTQQTVEAEIVETPKVELPPMPEMFVAAYYDRDLEAWQTTGGDVSPERAVEGTREFGNPLDYSIVVYRLGPPKPRMTEAEVRGYIDTILNGIRNDCERETAELSMLRLARALGVIGSEG